MLAFFIPAANGRDSRPVTQDFARARHVSRKSHYPLACERASVHAKQSETRYTSIRNRSAAENTALATLCLQLQI